LRLTSWRLIVAGRKLSTVWRYERYVVTVGVLIAVGANGRNSLCRVLSKP
jgi:hypothetical protein